jgi:hypothetical protein
MSLAEMKPQNEDWYLSHISRAVIFEYGIFGEMLLNRSLSQFSE